MNIQQTFDVDLIKSVVTMPVIWDVITEDGHQPEYYEPVLQNKAWVTLMDSDTLVGLVAFDHVNQVTLNVHPMVLPHKRAKSREIIRALIGWWVTHAPTHYQKIIAEIPVIYLHVRRFAELMGLELEGIRRSSFMKNGNIIDVYLYGATRQQLREHLINGQWRHRQERAKCADSKQ